MSEERQFRMTTFAKDQGRCQVYRIQRFYCCGQGHRGAFEDGWAGRYPIDQSEQMTKSGAGMSHAMIVQGGIETQSVNDAATLQMEQGARICPVPATPA